MAELDLKQIVDKLNTEFTGQHRKLVFWYDDKGDFAEDIDSVELTNAKVYKLTKDNQFYTKYFLEKEDTMLYSKRFYADGASLLSVDLGIEEKYIKFFGNKERL